MDPHPPLNTNRAYGPCTAKIQHPKSKEKKTMFYTSIEMVGIHTTLWVLYSCPYLINTMTVQ